MKQKTSDDKNKDLSLGYCLNNPNKIILEKIKIRHFRKNGSSKSEKSKIRSRG